MRRRRRPYHEQLLGIGAGDGTGAETGLGHEGVVDQRPLAGPRGDVHVEGDSVEPWGQILGGYNVALVPFDRCDAHDIRHARGHGRGGGACPIGQRGQISSQAVELTAPTSPGTYYYGACVDAVTGESDTTNNCYSTPITVRDAHLGRTDADGGDLQCEQCGDRGYVGTVQGDGDAAAHGALTVNLKYVEYITNEDTITYYPWPPPETTVTITAGSSSTTLTVDTIDDSDADGNSALQAWVASGSGYTRDPGRSIAVVAVVDDDGPAGGGDSVATSSVVDHAGKHAGLRRNGTVEFTVSANPAPTAAVTVGYRVYETGSTFSEALGAAFQRRFRRVLEVPRGAGWNHGTVTIGAGQTSATLSFGTVNDSTDEEDSEVGVTLRVDTYPDGVELGRPATAYVTVLDDD